MNMKNVNERINLLIAEIDNDLKAMEYIEKQIDELYNNLEKSNVLDKDKAALGYYLHNLYNAIESILKCIAGFFENSINGAGWHTDLLKRMTFNIEDIRPAIISKNSYALLNELRKFRHLFRHAYDYELSWKKMDELLKDYKKGKLSFTKDMDEFKNFILKLKL